MPLLSQLVDENDPLSDEPQQQSEIDFGDEGDVSRRGRYSVGDEVGRRAIQKAQPGLEGPGVRGFFYNLAGDAKDFAEGIVGLASMPVTQPEKLESAFQHPIDTAQKVGGLLVDSYKQAYTPQENESVPGMIMRRMYEKPFSTLMDASAVGQLAFGGAGALTRAATSGLRTKAGSIAAKGLALGGIESSSGYKLASGISRKASFGEPSSFEHSILDASGKNVGRAIIEPRGTEAHIKWLGGNDTERNMPALKLGQSAIRDLGRQIIEQYPDTLSIHGERMGGSYYGRAGNVIVSKNALMKGASKAPTFGAAELSTIQRAATAERAIDLFDTARARAKLIDPLTIAQETGKAGLKTFFPDTYAAMQTTRQMTDALAERTALMRAAEDEHTAKVNEAFSGLNTAEREVIHPYIAGRVNMDRPMGEQLMTHTGEWVPLRGDVIRPDALEAARQAYEPLRQELQAKQGMMPEQVSEQAGMRAMNYAKEQLKENFDPLDPVVQGFTEKYTQSALARNDEVLKSRATGEMRTALDISKEKKWRTELEQMVHDNMYASIKDAEGEFPRPEMTTPDEAIAVMGPQGGVYWPHSSEADAAGISTIDRHLKKLGEASTFKNNTMAMFRSGIMEHNDPVHQLVRAFMTFEKGNTWLDHAIDAAEQGVKDGIVTKHSPKDFHWATDPRVQAGTHQPFFPGRHMAEDLTEEEAQRVYTRLMEVADDPAVKGSNVFDNFRGMVENEAGAGGAKLSEKVPAYMVPTGMGRAFKGAKDAATPTTNPILHLLDPVTQAWNWTNLNLKLTRIINNVAGNSAFAVMQGVHPFTPRGLQALISTGQALASKAGLTKSGKAASLAKVFDMPGVRGGGLMQMEKEASGAIGEKVSNFMARPGETGFTAGAARAAGAPVRAVGKWGKMLANANTNIESAYRAASMFYELAPTATQRAQKMFGHATESMALGERIEGFARSGREVTMALPEYRQALRNVNRFFNNYDRATPLERQFIRRIFPYHKFFQHSTDLITRYPFEHPLKGAMVRTLGAAAMRDTKEKLKEWGFDWNRDVPEPMQNSIPLSRTTGSDGKPLVWMYSTKGADPFSQMSGPMSEQLLQMLNPMVKIAMEQMTGVNLFTRERYRGSLSSYTGREVDPKTGQIVDSFNRPSAGEQFLRSFWPYQMAREYAAAGRIPTDTASLFSMVAEAPGTWIRDSHGRAMQKEQWSRAQALGKFAGISAQPLQLPTKEQKAQRKAVINNQLNSLTQMYGPEGHASINEALKRSREEIDAEIGQAGGR